MLKTIVILIIGLSMISCSKEDKPTPPSSTPAEELSAPAETVETPSSADQSTEEQNNDSSGETAPVENPVQEQQTDEETQQTDKEAHSPAISSTSDEIDPEWDEELIGYSKEKFDSILDSLSGLYMRPVLINGNIVKKFKIELVYDKDNETFEMRLAHDRESICYFSSAYLLHENLTLDKKANLFKDGEWTLTLPWPELMALYIPSHTTPGNLPYSVKVNTMEIKVKENYEVFGSNIFSVDPSSIQIDIDPIEGVTPSNEWTFLHKDIAYEGFNSVECL